MKKIILIIITILLIVTVTAYFIIQSIAASGLPDYNKNVQLKGLKEEVKVFRDKFGIPHIIAKNEDDLYRVTGYIIAQDRMWQMDLLRRVTQGRLSEIFGDDMIGADKLFRALRIPDKSDIILAESDKRVIKALEAFSDGINQYIKNDNLSFEFKVLGYKPDKWKPKHSINLIGYMAWDLSSAWKSEISMFKIKQKVNNDIFKELALDLNFQKDVVYPNFVDSVTITANLLNEFDKVKNIVPEIVNGSNNWVVSGKKSTTGKPIFANDMHLGFMIPGIWSQIHQYIDGGLDVTGVILPGAPFVISGHNNKIAWGMTNVTVDDMDFYIEKINKDTTQYMFNSEWKDFILKKEIINVKGGKKVEKTIRFTHRGPVISDIKKTNKVISMHWIGNEPSNELRSLYFVNRARNWKEFREAVKTFKAVSQNIAYADVEGNIGLQCCAGVPIRFGNGNTVFPGDTSKYDWNGFYSFDKLPNSYNPKCGYVYSANNRTTASDSFYIGWYFALPYRANRIKQMLNSKDKLSIEDFKNMHTDQHSTKVDEIKPIIINHLKQKEFSQIETIAIEKLTKWDNILTKKGSETLIFEVFIKLLKKNIIKDELGDELYKEYPLSGYLIDKLFKTQVSILCDDVNTEGIVEDFDDMIIKSFKETISFLTEKYGNNIDDWKWGNMHKLELKHPLGKNKILDFAFNLNRTYEVGGSNHTVSPYAYRNNFTAVHGASHRHIYSTADWNKSQTIIPTGVSDIPTSKHYCDQTEMYINGIYHNDYVDTNKIKESAVYTAVFSKK